MSASVHKDVHSSPRTLDTHLNVSCHKHQDASRNRGLEVLGTEVDLAGSELQGAHLAHDGLGAHELLALKRQHGRILVQGSL
eukprot:1139951-Pelagomonas_calceolata.AAC.2